MANTSPVSPAPLSRHQRWPEPSGASTMRVYAMRIRQGIGPAGRAERKRLKRKAARDRFKAAHPNRKQELAAVRGEQERLGESSIREVLVRRPALRSGSAGIHQGARFAGAAGSGAEVSRSRSPRSARKHGLNVNSRHPCGSRGSRQRCYSVALLSPSRCLYVPAAQAVALAAQLSAGRHSQERFEHYFVEFAAALGNGAAIAAELDKPAF